jgi:hypothetical protein
MRDFTGLLSHHSLLHHPTRQTRRSGSAPQLQLEPGSCGLHGPLHMSPTGYHVEFVSDVRGDGRKDLVKSIVQHMKTCKPASTRRIDSRTRRRRDMTCEGSRRAFPPWSYTPGTSSTPPRQPKPVPGPLRHRQYMLVLHGSLSDTVYTSRCCSCRIWQRLARHNSQAG